MTLVLTLAVEPSIDLLTNKHVNEGLNLSWICPGHGVPEPDITWYKDGKPVVDVPPRVAVRGSELRIDNLEISDGGSYSCSASNRAGSTQSARSNRAQLIVNERFKFVQTLSDACIQAGVKKQFKCAVTGSASTQIQWTKVNGTKPVPVA
uniref:Ig-like domain-containing protein n=1 Tax=Ciona savignyi TaxID=51511 RepID=H2ZF90_CIOSA